MYSLLPRNTQVESNTYQHLLNLTSNNLFRPFTPSTRSLCVFLVDLDGSQQPDTKKFMSLKEQQLNTKGKFLNLRSMEVERQLNLLFNFFLPSKKGNRDD